jgi:hypothetical protein
MSPLYLMGLSLHVPTLNHARCVVTTNVSSFFLHTPQVLTDHSPHLGFPFSQMILLQVPMNSRLGSGHQGPWLGAQSLSRGL